MKDKILTHAVERVIRVPPEAPTTIFILSSLPVIIEGHVEDNGRHPGPGAFIIGRGYLSPNVDDLK